MLQARFPWVYLCLIAVAGPTQGADVDQLLADLFAGRAALQTGQVELERVNSVRGIRQSQSLTFANDEIAVRHLPGDDGLRLGRPEVEYSDGDIFPRYTLIRGDERWEYGFGSPFFATVLSRSGYPGGVTSPLALGLSPRLAVGDFDEFRQSLLPEGVTNKLTYSRDGKLVVRVEAEEDAVEWELDSTHGNQPVRVTFFRDDNVISESKTEYRYFDNVWFPERIEYFRADYAGGKTPAEVVKVKSAEFNRPSHLKRLTPAFIGVEPGVNVEIHEAPGQIALRRIWSGEDLLTQEEFREALRAGRIKYGPRLSAEMDAQQRLYPQGLPLETLVKSVAVGPAKFESKWEQYTREFIARFDLSAEQAEKCQQILKDCQQRANDYLTRRASEFGELKADLAQLQAAPEISASKFNKILQRQQALEAPIERVFEDQLKPRLDAIPSPAQRKAASVQAEDSTAQP